MDIKKIILFFELITALTATITWNKYRFTGGQNFVYFFWVVFVADVSGVIMGLYSLKTFFLYNSLCIFYFCFLLKWYYNLLQNKTIVKLLAANYFSSLIYSFFNQSFFNQNYTIGLVSGCLVLLFCSLIYFYQILQSDKILHVKHSLPFWLTIGNIIYFVGLLPIMLLQKYIGASDLIYSIVLTIVNFITYSCYTIGFIWTKKK